MDKKIIGLKKGVIVSDAMDKTVVVAVDRVKKHPLYKKNFTITKKYKAHDESNEYKKDDLVEIVSCAPLSRDKHYKVLRKIEK